MSCFVSLTVSCSDKIRTLFLSAGYYEENGSEAVENGFSKYLEFSSSGFFEWYNAALNFSKGLLKVREPLNKRSGLTRQRTRLMIFGDFQLQPTCPGEVFGTMPTPSKSRPAVSSRKTTLPKDYARLVQQLKLVICDAHPKERAALRAILKDFARSVANRARAPRSMS